MTSPRFAPEALSFLRALKRNNDREWFRSRKDKYEALLREPMIALIDRLAHDFAVFAPDLVANAKTSLYRIYRDTRFSENKAPLKTHIAAVFPCRGLGKHQGAGLYLEVAPEWVWVGGGLYAPETSPLHAVRAHIAANFRRFKTIVESPAFRRSVGPLAGSRLQRVPRGFPPDHEAAEFLKHRQFLAAREFPASFATSPRFYAGVVGVFRQVAPLIRFLNEPLLEQVRLPSPRLRPGKPDTTQMGVGRVLSDPARGGSDRPPPRLRRSAGTSVKAERTRPTTR